MKISNSKKELARIISENGGWRDGVEWAVQNGGHGRISFSENKPSRHGRKSWMAEGGFQFKIERCKPIGNWHQTILSREEYFHLYPAPDADGWIEWKSKFYGDIPCDENCIVDIMESDGGVFTGFIAKNWKHWGSVKAYRLHKTEQAKHEFCESVTRSIPEPESKPTIEQLAADYRNRKGCADRKQQEADEAKADAEAKLAELVAAGKDIGLVVSVTEKEPELVITDWRDLQVGDEIEVVESTGSSSEGRTGVVSRFDKTDDKQPVRVIFNGGECDYDWPTKWRFIRRP